MENLPPFGTIRKTALALYKPPFKFHSGYIWDREHNMVADDAGVDAHIASRVRGWGHIGYMPNAEKLQDEVGNIIAEALTQYWALADADRAQRAAPAVKPRLIGWRTSDFLMETADKAKAENWQVHHEIQPIFEGDPHTSLKPPEVQAAPYAQLSDQSVEESLKQGLLK